MSESDRGPRGKQGVQGFQGVEGEQGEAGGPKGDTGARGATGARGPRAKRRPEWRDFWMLGLSVVLLVVALNDQSTSSKENSDNQAQISHNRDAIRAVQQGRKSALTVSCAVTSAISLAGRTVIEGASMARETPLTRFLEQHGFPPPGVRARQAAASGKAYVDSINANITARLHQNVKGLVEKNGTINCVKFQQLGIVGKGAIKRQIAKQRR
jgi:hypothetical protein